MTAHPYRLFWEHRGSNAFWLTTHFGYRPGAVLAWLAARWGLTPNILSFLSLVMAGVALAPLVVASWPPFWEGAWLAAFLLLSYWLDCADGPLARVTGASSSFGAVLDKTMDMTVAVLTASVLGVAALGSQSWWIPASWQVVILPLTLVPRAAFSTLNWLKDEQLHRTSRLREYVPPQTWLGRAKRFAGNFTDDTVLRLGAGLSWGVGCYWEFSLALHALFLVLLIGYILSSKRDFDAFDQEKAIPPLVRNSESL